LKYVSIAEDSLGRLIRQSEDKSLDSKWQEKKSEGSVRIISGKLSHIPYNVFKGRGIIEASCSKVFAIMSDAKFQEEYSPNYKLFTSKKRLGPNCEILYLQTNPVGPISSRDQVQVRAWKRYKGGYASSACSIKVSGMDQVSGCVRANTPPGGGFVLTPLGPNKCLMCNFMVADVKGWVPRSAVELTIGGALFKFYTQSIPKWISVKGDAWVQGVLKDQFGQEEKEGEDVRQGDGKEAGEKNANSTRPIETKTKASEAVIKLSEEERGWMIIAEKSSQKFLKEVVADHSHWTVKASNATSKVLLGNMDGIGYRVFKASSIVNCSAEKLFQMILDPVVTEKWNPSYKLFKRKKRLSKEADVVYFQTNKVGPISSRDEVQVRKWGRFRDGYFATNCSIEWKELGPVSGCVRAHTPVGAGYIILPHKGDPSKCAMTNFFMGDIKGWVPRSAVEMTVGDTLYKFYNTDVPKALQTVGAEITADDARRYIQENMESKDGTEDGKEDKKTIMEPQPESKGGWKDKLSSSELKYVSIAEDSLGRLIRQSEDKSLDSKWQEKKSEGSVRIISGKLSHIPYNVFKGRGIIEASCSKVFAIMSDAKFQEEYSPNYKLFTSKKRLGPNCEILYLQTNPVGPISSRDQVQVRAWKRYKGGYASSACSIKVSGMDQVSGCVRANTPPGGGFVLTPLGPNKCLMCNFMVADVKGWVPRSAVELTIGGALFKFYTQSIPKWISVKGDAWVQGVLKDQFGQEEKEGEDVRQGDENVAPERDRKLSSLKERMETKEGPSPDLDPKRQRWVDLGMKSMEKLLKESEAEHLDWQEKISKGKIKVYSGNLPGINYKVFKGTAIIDAHPAQLFKLCYDAELAQTWNPNHKVYKSVERITPQFDIVYVMTEAVGPISSRDQCQIRHWKRYKGGFASAACSIDHKGFQPSNDAVRAHTPPGGGFVIVPTSEGKSKMTNFMISDIKGYVPRFVIDKAIGGALLKFYQTSIPGALEAHKEKVSEEESLRYIEALEQVDKTS